MLAFYEMYPKYSHLDLFVIGESYGTWSIHSTVDTMVLKDRKVLCVWFLLNIMFVFQN